MALFVTEPICAIFNASLTQGHVPDLWRQANVIPVPMISPPKSVDTFWQWRYHSLPLWVIFASHLWVDESWTALATNLTKPVWCIKNNARRLTHLLASSTTGKTLLIVETLLRSLLVDYSKPYDQLNQNILLHKMIAMNVSQFAVRWLFSFLKGWIQRVKLRSSNTFSDWIEITAGMPQGTWLRPLTFAMYIDDLNPQCVVQKFIDDTTLTVILLKGNESAHNCMPQYLDNLLTWSTNNCMVINSKKTKEMILGIANKSPPPLTISNIPVERATCFKLLGINNCNNFRLDAHVGALCSKVASRLYFLKLHKRSGLSADDLVFL